MKVTPIIMSAPMVRALLEGRKTQTRRLNGLEDVNKFPDAWNHASLGPLEYTAKPSARGKYGATFGSKPGALQEDSISICPAACPYGGPGDLLWVRENAWLPREAFPWELREGAETWRPDYYADGITPTDVEQYKQWGWKPTPSIRMPRRISRLTLELTGVRVQRLNDISEEDSLTEGVVHDAAAAYLRFYVPGVEHPNQDFPELSRTNAREMYAALWDCLHGSGQWLANLWVWALSFRVHQVNIDVFLTSREAA